MRRSVRQRVSVIIAASTRYLSGRILGGPGGGSTSTAEEEGGAAEAEASAVCAAEKKRKLCGAARTALNGTAAAASNSLFFSWNSTAVSTPSSKSAFASQSACMVDGENVTREAIGETARSALRHSIYQRPRLEDTHQRSNNHDALLLSLLKNRTSLAPHLAGASEEV